MAFERTPKQKKDAPESEINWIPSSPKIVSAAVVDVSLQTNQNTVSHRNKMGRRPNDQWLDFKIAR
jgi:hypothetical protein